MNTSLGLGLIVFFRSELPLLRANLPSLALIVVKILLFSVKISENKNSFQSDMFVNSSI